MENSLENSLENTGTTHAEFGVEIEKSGADPGAHPAAVLITMHAEFGVEIEKLISQLTSQLTSQQLQCMQS